MAIKLAMLSGDMGQPKKKKLLKSKLVKTSVRCDRGVKM